MPKIIINDDECIGCESCVEICPEVFEFDDDTNIATVIDPHKDANCVQEAIDSCPVECIEWQDAS